MTHTFKKVALFAAVVSVAAVGADKKAILAVLDKVVALDTLVGAGTNVVVAGVNGLVNGQLAVKGLKIKDRASVQFLLSLRDKKQASVFFRVGSEAPAKHGVSAKDLLAKGLEINKEGMVVGKATSEVKVIYAKAEHGATLILAGETYVVDADKELSKAAMKAATADVLKKAGMKVVDKKLVVVDADVVETTVAGIEAAEDKSNVSVDVTSKAMKSFNFKGFAQGAVSVLATTLHVASFLNTVRHLMAKKAAQVEETEVVDAEQVVEDVA